jgi:hypothetical protein
MLHRLFGRPARLQDRLWVGIDFRRRRLMGGFGPLHGMFRQIADEKKAAGRQDSQNHEKK